jgi:hypothetical protein
VNSFPLRLPESLKEIAASQAEREGVSLNQYILTAVAMYVGSQSEADRYFALRAARSQPGEAEAILARAGKRKTPRPGDELD